MRCHLGTEAQEIQQSDLYMALEGTLTVGRKKIVNHFHPPAPALILHWQPKIRMDVFQVASPLCCKLVKPDPSSLQPAISPGDSPYSQNHPTIYLLFPNTHLLTYIKNSQALRHTYGRTKPSAHVKVWLSGVIMWHGDRADETSAVSSTASRWHNTEQPTGHRPSAHAHSPHRGLMWT